MEHHAAPRTKFPKPRLPTLPLHEFISADTIASAGSPKCIPMNRFSKSCKHFQCQVKSGVQTHPTPDFSNASRAAVGNLNNRPRLKSPPLRSRARYDRDPAFHASPSAFHTSFPSACGEEEQPGTIFTFSGASSRFSDFNRPLF